MLRGSHCLRSWSKTQNTVAQSSAESELLGTVRAATESLGMAALAQDLGIQLKTRLHVDASAALGILERRGVGRVRHLDVGTLWLQEQRLQELVEFRKVLGTRNPADLMTKHLARDLVDACLKTLHFELREGRADSTAKLHQMATNTASNGSPKTLREERITRSKDKASKKTWVETGKGNWTASFKRARAHRSPSSAGIPWEQVLRRCTIDAYTHEVPQDCAK